MMTALLPLLAAASLCRAADPAALSAADALFKNRHQEGKLASSTARLEALGKAQPDDYEVLWRLGRNRLETGRRKTGKDARLQAFAEAAQALRRATRLKPDGARGHYWLAAEIGAENDIRRTLGLAKSMKSEVEKALELDASFADARQLHCELLHQLPGLFGGDKKLAVTECETALKLTPDETSRYPALAEAYLAVKRKDDAVAVLERVFAVKQPADPGSADDDLRAARALLQKLTGSPEPK